MNPLCRSSLPSFATCGENDFDPDKNPIPGPGNFNSIPFLVAYQAIDPTAQYIIAGQGAKSTTGRSVLQLNPINNIDFNVTKRFNITERYSVQFGAYTFNLFNHSQFIGGYLNYIAPLGFTGTERSMLIPNQDNFNNPRAVFSSNPRTMVLSFKFMFNHQPARGDAEHNLRRSGEPGRLFVWCAEHDRQLGGVSPLHNQMEVK